MATCTHTLHTYKSMCEIKSMYSLRIYLFKKTSMFFQRFDFKKKRTRFIPFKNDQSRICILLVWNANTRKAVAMNCACIGCFYGCKCVMWKRSAHSLRFVAICCNFTMFVRFSHSISVIYYARFTNIDILLCSTDLQPVRLCWIVSIQWIYYL